MAIRDNANLTLYDSNREARDIWRVTQAETDALTDAAERIFNNTRIVTSDIRGIEQWERVYGIIPDLARDSADDRIERILEFKRSVPPYSERWLQAELFRRTGDDTITVEVRGLRTHLAVAVPLDAEAEAFMSRRVIRETVPWLRHILPANVMLYYEEKIAEIDIRNRNEAELYDIAYDSPPESAKWNGEHGWDGSIKWRGTSWDGLLNPRNRNDVSMAVGSWFNLGLNTSTST